MVRLTATRIWPIESVHDGHVGGPKKYNNFPLGSKFYFYANIFYCFSPPTWPPCTHSITKDTGGWEQVFISEGCLFSAG